MVARAGPVARDLIEEIVDELPDGVAVTDADGRIVFANARLEDLSGYPRAVLLGGSVEMLVPERLQAVHREHRARYQSAPHLRTMGANLETVVHRADGTEIPVDIALRPLSNRGGEFVVSTMRDARERREMQSRLQLVDDRQRIARGLQDGVIHALFGIGLELQAVVTLLDDTHVVERIDSCIAAADDCIAQLRDRIFDLQRAEPD